MKAVLGQYHYAPHRSFWGVWQWTEVSETGACGTFIKDFRSEVNHFASNARALYAEDSKGKTQ